jgi:hypothetical protein
VEQSAMEIWRAAQQALEGCLAQGGGHEAVALDGLPAPTLTFLCLDQTLTKAPCLHDRRRWSSMAKWGPSC